ncbi:MAG: DMT family transporter [Candidatus Heimdallarchaeota archaeon]|nr:DMT family transporter [Candidatus Heimdallarchaeota archaeon]
MEAIVEGSGVKSDYRIYVLLLSVVMFWGASWPAGSIISKSVPPITAAFIRYTISLPFFFAAALIVDRNIRLEKRMHLKIIPLGIMQVSLYNIFFLTGLKYTGPSDAVLIIAMNPTITAIIASLLYQDEKLTKFKIQGLVTALLGVAIVVILSPNVDVPNRLLGNFIIFLAAFTWAAFTAFARPVLREVKPLTFTAWGSFYGWLLLLILSPIQGPWFIKMESNVIYGLIYLALVAGVYGNIIYNSGVRRIGPSRTSIFVNLVPIFGVISSLFILPEEKFSFWYVVSIILILRGVSLVNRKPKNNNKMELINPH